METICDVLIYSRRIYDNSAWQFVLVARNYHRGMFIVVDFWWKFELLETAIDHAKTLIDVQFPYDQCFYGFDQNQWHLEETVS